MQHLRRINQNHWTMAEEKRERDGLGETNAYYPQRNNVGPSLNGEYTTGPQKVSRQWGLDEPERQEDFETKTADQIVSTICNEQTQDAMVSGDDEASPCRVESPRGHSTPYTGCH